MSSIYTREGIGFRERGCDQRNAESNMAKQAKADSTALRPRFRI